MYPIKVYAKGVLCCRPLTLAKHLLPPTIWTSRRYTIHKYPNKGNLSFAINQIPPDTRVAHGMISLGQVKAFATH